MAAGLNYKDHCACANDYFGQNYDLQLHRLNESHNYCRKKVQEMMKKKVTPIFVDNTNIKLEEMKPYCKMASENGYKVQVVVAGNPNTWVTTGHPFIRKEILEKMKREFEPIESGEALMKYFRYPMV